MSVSPLSLTTFQLQQWFNDTKLSTGTGFFWRSGEHLYLVTNWHVVTGRDQQSGRCLHTMGAIPNKLTFTFHQDPKREDGQLLVSSAVWHPYDDLGQPVWMEHPTAGSTVDIVMLHIGADPQQSCFCINDNVRERMSMAVGDDAYVLGFPEGIATPTPLWKRATIASEPKLDINNLPVVLVDTASRPGMSGAPVIVFARSSYPASGGSMIVSPGEHHRLLGVYSGRHTVRDGIDSQLGFVWRASLIDDIHAGQVRGRIPEAT
jgi:hypothetical protein